jgi:hypothetical protein
MRILLLLLVLLPLILVGGSVVLALSLVAIGRRRWRRSETTRLLRQWRALLRRDDPSNG